MRELQLAQDGTACRRARLRIGDAGNIKFLPGRGAITTPWLAMDPTRVSTRSDMNDRHLAILRAQLQRRRASIPLEGDGALATDQLDVLIGTESRAGNQLRQAKARRIDAPPGPG